MKKLILISVVVGAFTSCQKVEPGDIWTYTTHKGDPFTDCGGEQKHIYVVEEVKNGWVKYHEPLMEVKYGPYCETEELSTFRMSSTKVGSRKNK